MFAWMSSRGTITGAVSGFTAAFAIASTFLMNPANMLKWALHTDSSEVKVDRALKAPSDVVLDMKSEIQTLQEKVILCEDESKSSRSNLLKNYELVQKDLITCESHIKSSDEEHEQAINELTLKLKQKHDIAVAQASVKPLDTFESDITESKRAIEEIDLNKITFKLGEPVKLKGGSISLVASANGWGGCKLHLKSFSRHTNTQIIDVGMSTPKELVIDNTHYAIYLDKYDTKERLCIFTSHKVQD